MLKTDLETILTGSDRANYWHLKTRFTELSKNLSSYSDNEVIEIHNYLNPQISRLSKSKDKNDKKNLRKAKSLQKKILSRLGAEELDDVHIPGNLNYMMTGEGKEYHRIKNRIPELSKYVDENDCSLEQLDFLYKETDRRIKSFRSLDRKSARSNVRILKSFRRKVKEKMDTQLFMENFDKRYSQPSIDNVISMNDFKIRRDAKPILLTDVMKDADVSTTSETQGSAGFGIKYGLLASAVLLLMIGMYGFASNLNADVVTSAYANTQRPSIVRGVPELRFPVNHLIRGVNYHVLDSADALNAFHPNNLKDNPAVKELQHYRREHIRSADAIHKAVNQVAQLPPFRYVKKKGLERLIAAQANKESDFVHVLPDGTINSSVADAGGCMQWRPGGFAEYQRLLKLKKDSKYYEKAYAGVPEFTFEDVMSTTEMGRTANVFTATLYMKFLTDMYKGDTELARLDFNMGRTVLARVIKKASGLHEPQVDFPEKHTVGDMRKAYNAIGRLSGIAPYVVDEPESYITVTDEHMNDYPDAHSMVQNLDWANTYHFFTNLSGRAMQIKDLDARKRFIEARWELAMSIDHSDLKYRGPIDRNTVANTIARGKELLRPFYN